MATKEKAAEITSAAVVGAPPASPQPSETTPSSGGDMDVAQVEKKHYKGEVAPLVLAGFWVRLGRHKSVPERYQGHIASVVDSPVKPVPFNTGREDVHGYQIDPKGSFVVRTRDEADATFEVPFEAFEAVADSRSALTHIG